MEGEEGGDGREEGEEGEGGLVCRRGEDFADGLWRAGAVFFGALVACWGSEDACLAWVCCRGLIPPIHRLIVCLYISSSPWLLRML